MEIEYRIPSRLTQDDKPIGHCTSTGWAQRKG